MHIDTSRRRGVEIKRAVGHWRVEGFSRQRATERQLHLLVERFGKIEAFVAELGVLTRCTEDVGTLAAANAIQWWRMVRNDWVAVADN